jgi:prolyl 4-hydroxylase
MKRAVVATLLIVAVAVVAVVILWPVKRGPRGYTEHHDPWEEPRIVNSVITKAECDAIIKTAEENFARSELVGVEGGSDNSRTSETAWISKEHPTAQKVLRRACELTGRSFENCEDVQVVRYKPGTYYRRHHDSCCEDSKACLDFENRGGQRTATLLVYLNDEFTDGETHFPHHKGGLKLKAQPGSAIFFRPLGAETARCHPKALHEGLPISSGTKYVCNVWIREGTFK